MALSDHQMIADGVRAAVAAWADLPAGWSVARVYSVTRAVGQLPADQAGAVSVLVSAIESEVSGRKTDQDTVAVAVVCTVRVADDLVATADAVDLLLQSLRSDLRALRSVALNDGRAGRRLSCSMPTVFDAEWLRDGEIFVAFIECRFLVSVAVA